MNNYFRAVTLGAFTWKNEERINLLLENIRKIGSVWLAVHFLLLTFCLNFPVVFQIARISPQELNSRLYGYTESAEQLAAGNMLMPVLWISFSIMLIIQAAFYLCTVFFLGLSRMNVAPLSFRDRMGLSLFSSTLPVLAAAIFGMFLPAVHIIIYYFVVMFFVFQRSKLCPDG